MQISLGLFSVKINAITVNRRTLFVFFAYFKRGEVGYGSLKWNVVLVNTEAVHELRLRYF